MNSFLTFLGSRLEANVSLFTNGNGYGPRDKILVLNTNSLIYYNMLYIS